jgi:hypothetical protein
MEKYMKKIPTYLWLIGTVLLVAGLNYLLPSTPQNSTVLIIVLIAGGFAARFAGRDGPARTNAGNAGS